MIKLNYGNIRDQNFANGVVRLRSFSGFKPKTAYNLGRVLDKINRAEKEAQIVFDNLIELHAEKDKDGKLVEYGGRPGTFKIADEKADEWREILEAFEAISVEPIERYRLKLDELENVKLTPAEMLALDPLIVVVEDVKEEAVSPVVSIN